MTTLLAALAWQQVATASRTPAIWVAIIGHVLLLSLYVIVWGDGIPLAGARAPFEQFTTAYTALMVVLLPWVATRCLGVGTRNDVAIRAVLTAQRPLVVVFGATLGLAVVLLMVIVTGLPVIVLAQQTSEHSSWEVARLVARFAGLGACLAPVSLAATLLSESRLWGWVLGIVASSVLAAATPAGLAGSTMLWPIAGGAVAIVADHAERRWRYLAEDAR
jgi:hypothetical protein